MKCDIGKKCNYLHPLKTQQSGAEASAPDTPKVKKKKHRSKSRGRNRTRKTGAQQGAVEQAEEDFDGTAAGGIAIDPRLDSTQANLEGFAYPQVQLEPLGL